ncbi:Alpha/Beta hydrolase protein [Kockovaella imperatae]|uniref:Alpha/Beta hydrolase protein n=1 Tax=Kockovaella imperatae TaxID=4999 RepID=A0A1Y1UNX8_9TREE|nr:Alpha/Beta hydrolase protein [Kockovaella imperatae]ORX39743.1 Alpha/Beta hydrolase protein [Kockovaella imperatae]
MIDHILGRPSPSLRRAQILLVLSFWVWRLYKGDGAPRPKPTPSHGYPPVPYPSVRVGAARGASSAVGRRKNGWLVRLWIGLVGRRFVRWIGRVNERLKNFTPYQLILGTLTLVYALRHVSDIFGLEVPEPLASLYTRSFYRATYINTALDAGFASAMAMRPKWVRDIFSVLFSAYYMIYVSEGDEVLRRFRALCTVEMLRTTWEKTNNPYIRLATYFQRPSLPIVRDVLISRPAVSSRSHLPPVRAMLFFNGTDADLAKAKNLIMDFPGGGFIAMGPECHEERLRRWAKRTGKPVLGVRYGKAPEYPFPWAIEEGLDAYRTLVETRGRGLGITSGKLSIVLTGDSAGANLCTTIMLRILEHPAKIPRPVSLILGYPALDFNFTSWMSPADIRVLRTEQSESHMPAIIQGKDHLRHKSPLSAVDDVGDKRQRQRSWGHTLGSKVAGLAMSPLQETLSSLPNASQTGSSWTKALPRSMSTKIAGWLAPDPPVSELISENLSSGTEESDPDDDGTITVRGVDTRREADKSLRERVKTPHEERRSFNLSPLKTSPRKAAKEEEDVANRPPGHPRKKKAPIGTRLTMTSRVGYFQDKIISPSMMRAMAILYIGPHRNPDFETDYYISPILAPPHLLAQFPPVYLICGERDPFVDDTVIFAGKIRDAKRHRKAEAESKQNGARFGEGLRMTTSARDQAGKSDRILRETEEDWVVARIIAGWGHGFLQMASLMKEVDSIMTEMADWIDESFERAAAIEKDEQDIAAVERTIGGEDPALLSPTEQIPPPSSTHVKPVRSYKESGSRQSLGGADLGAPFAPDITVNEEDGTITFTPRSARRKRPPPSQYQPVVRRRSKENLGLHRSDSAPRFDIDETGSSGEAVHLQTPTLSTRNLPASNSEPRGSRAFAFFNSSRSGKPSGVSPPVAIESRSRPSLSSTNSTSLFARRPSATHGSVRTNSLVAAAVAGARAASPALAAAGLVPEKVGDVSEVELMRRRRMEAVFGLGGETDSAVESDDEDDEDQA